MKQYCEASMLMANEGGQQDALFPLNPMGLVRSQGKVVEQGHELPRSP